jgi:hypothetical protein
MLPPRGTNRVRDSRLKTLHGKLHSGLVGLSSVTFMGLAMSSVPVRGPGHRLGMLVGVSNICRTSRMVANLSSRVMVMTFENKEDPTVLQCHATVWLSSWYQPVGSGCKAAAVSMMTCSCRLRPQGLHRDFQHVLLPNKRTCAVRADAIVTVSPPRGPAASRQLDLAGVCTDRMPVKCGIQAQKVADVWLIM